MRNQVRFWLDRERRIRDRALFDLAIDSKLRCCDVVKIRIGELVSGGRVRTRATVTQQKTGRPVQFELLEPARSSLQTWLERRGGTIEDYAFPSRTDHARHIGELSGTDQACQVPHQLSTHGRSVTSNAQVDRCWRCSCR